MPSFPRIQTFENLIQNGFFATFAIDGSLSTVLIIIFKLFKSGCNTAPRVKFPLSLLQRLTVCAISPHGYNHGMFVLTLHTTTHPLSLTQLACLQCRKLFATNTDRKLFSGGSQWACNGRVKSLDRPFQRKGFI
jgi:hypothetical protein